MIKQIAHICLRTEDLQRTEAFYCQALGMERFFEFERKGVLFGYYLKAGSDTFIEVFKGDPGEEAQLVDPGEISLELVETLVVELEGLGVELE